MCCKVDNLKVLMNFLLLTIKKGDILTSQLWSIHLGKRNSKMVKSITESLNLKPTFIKNKWLKLTIIFLASIGTIWNLTFLKTQNYCSPRVAIKISTSSMISRSIKIGVIKIFLKLNLVDSTKWYTKILQAHSLRCCGTAFIIHWTRTNFQTWTWLYAALPD